MTETGRRGISGIVPQWGLGIKRPRRLRNSHTASQNYPPPVSPGAVELDRQLVAVDGGAVAKALASSVVVQLCSIKDRAPCNPLLQRRYQIARDVRAPN